MTIIQATEKEFVSCCEISGTSVSWKIEVMHRSMFGKNSAAYCATRDGRVLGYVCLESAKDRCVISSLFVDQQHRRSGIATALIESAVKHAHDNKMKSLSLKTAKDNTAAIELYKKVGFDVTGSIRDYYGSDRDAVVMHKCIFAPVA